MATSRSLCVAICTRNRPQELAECLLSVTRSSLVAQVVVSTDGSDLETELVAQSMASQFRDFEFVRGPRTGLAANRNAALEAVRTEYVLFLDDDARLNPEFLEMSLAVSGPERLVTGWEMRAGEKVTPHDPDFLGFQNREPGEEPKGIVINATIFPVSFLRRRSFDEFYRYGSEEIDIAFAAQTQGLHLVEVDAGNDHLHVSTAREGNDIKAAVSRAYFGVRRYTEYEPSLARLLLFLPIAYLNWMWAELKAGHGQFLPAASRLYVGAVLAGLRAIKRPTLSKTGDPVAPRGRTAPPTISVVVPSYRRPQQLRACLQALQAQTCGATEVIVVRRDTDRETELALADSGSDVVTVVVSEPGQVAALRSGAAATTAEVIVFLDDDAIPRRDWLARVGQAMRNHEVGAVGGRDVVHHGDSIEDGAAHAVGVFSWYGKHLGNHHLGCGADRTVDFLKGCNAAYRRTVLRLPLGLRGQGAQVGNDMASSLAVKQAGFRVVYDPRIIVDHYPGDRFDADGRVERSSHAVLESVFNLSYVVSSLTSRSLRAKYLLYHMLVGDVTTPGVVRSLVGLWRQERFVTGRLLATQRMLIRGFLESSRRPLQMWPVESPGSNA